MRITGGQFRGRTIKAPAGLQVRPTTDKNRQAIFNVIQKFGLPGDAQVIDAFCGSGALGLEAISRGASGCVFIDRDRNSLSCTRDNAAALGLSGNIVFLQRDALKPGALPTGTPAAALAFLDPPYRQGLIPPALAGLAENGWLAPAAILVVESEKNGPGDELPDPRFETLDRRPYGDTLIRILRYQG